MTPTHIARYRYKSSEGSNIEITLYWIEVEPNHYIEIHDDKGALIMTEEEILQLGWDSLEAIKEQNITTDILDYID